jgi:hypothetical protein
MSFTLDLSRFASKTKVNADLIVKKIALEAFSGIILKTPVDTGRARANWTYAVGNYSDATSENVDRAGGSTIAKVSNGLMATRINGQMLYLTNSLPYIDRLEHGYSKQAPAGMVKLTLLEITSKYGT